MSKTFKNFKSLDFRYQWLSTVYKLKLLFPEIELLIENFLVSNFLIQIEVALLELNYLRIQIVLSNESIT